MDIFYGPSGSVSTRYDDICGLNSTRNRVDEEPPTGSASSKSLFINFIYFSLYKLFKLSFYNRFPGTNTASNVVTVSGTSKNF